jgi:ABC-type phosphate/phosphonate transport system substrate-binding protein
MEKSSVKMKSFAGSILLLAALSLGTTLSVAAGALTADAKTSATADVTSKTIVQIRYLKNPVSGVNLADARVALDVLFRKILLRRYPQYEVQMEFLSDQEEVLRSCRARELDYVTLTGLDYLQLREQGAPIRPIFISSRMDTPREQYVLIARNGVDLRKIQGSSPRRFLIEKGGSGAMARNWLDTALLEQSLPDVSKFFQTVREVDQASAAVLPVFFGQAEACVVPRSTYEVMIELNPQIGRKLSPLMTSPGFLRNLGCVRTDLDPETEKILLEVSLSMNTEPEGNQIMTIFGTKAVFKFEEQYIAETKALYQKHKKLKGKTESKNEDGG